MNTNDIRTAAAAVLAGQTTAELVAALLVADAVTKTPETRQARMWIIEAIEARYPEVNADMDAWAADVETELTYVEALIAALPVAAVAA
jgi:hypothetical protein